MENSKQDYPSHDLPRKETCETSSPGKRPSHVLRLAWALTQEQRLYVWMHQDREPASVQDLPLHAWEVEPLLFI